MTEWALQPLGEAVDEFEGKVLEGLPRTQVKEMRKAFCSGYVAALLALAGLPEDADDDAASEEFKAHLKESVSTMKEEVSDAG